MRREGEWNWSGMWRTQRDQCVWLPHDDDNDGGGEEDINPFPPVSRTHSARLRPRYSGCPLRGKELDTGVELLSRGERECKFQNKAHTPAQEL